MDETTVMLVTRRKTTFSS